MGVSVMGMETMDPSLDVVVSDFGVNPYEFRQGSSVVEM